MHSEKCCCGTWGILILASIALTIPFIFMAKDMVHSLRVIAEK